MKLTAAFLLMLSTCACATQVRISELLADPGHYDGKTVVTTGTVTKSASVLNYGTYEITDGSGNLTVVTTQGGAPRDNTRVEVKGTFHSGFALGTARLAVLEEKDRRPLVP